MIISETGFSQTDQIESIQFPKNVGYINDNEKLFNETEIKELTEIVSNYEKETSIQLVVVSIISYKPFETIDMYSQELLKNWSIGQKNGGANGIAIVFGKSIKQIHIQIGDGLKDNFNDEDAQQIIDNIIMPEFKDKDYFTGIKKGVLEIIKKIK